MERSDEELLFSSSGVASSLFSRVELLELGDGINGEEAHVICVHEANMVEMILLLEHDLVAESLREPSNILRRCHTINVS